MGRSPPPLPNSYWVEPDRILAGEHPAGTSEQATLERLQRLLDAGVDCFIDLTEPDEFESYERLLTAPPVRRDVVYLRKPIRDHGLPESVEKMREILDALDRALANGRRVYLHCHAGIGRTNLVAGCWVANQGGGGQAALERLNRDWRGSARSISWPNVPETAAQSEYVRGWKPPHSRRETAAANTIVTVAQDLRDRVRGLLLGLATGDSLGHALYGLPAGAWSDKTAMALCLAESLVSRGGHDAADQVEHYQAWQHTGRWSSTGASVGVSAATNRALATAQWTGNPYAGSHDPAHADAEPLARIGPAVVWYLDDPRAAIDAAVNCARITHQAPLTLDAVRYLASLLAGALAGASKAALLEPNYSFVPGALDAAALRPPISEIAAGERRGRKPRRMRRGRFAAAAALEAALAAFESGDDLAQCLQSAATRPGDAQTVAAIVGQLAGAHYGASALPSAWRAGLALGAEIEAMADRLLDAAGHAARA
ncbi:MAG: ADP-ribosylglycohydrolase family protein [Steroidobacteraceae bacterium]